MVIQNLALKHMLASPQCNLRKVWHLKKTTALGLSGIGPGGVYIHIYIYIYVYVVYVLMTNAY